VKRASPRRSNPCLPLVALALSLHVSPAVADDYDAAFTRAIAAKERALDTNDPASWQAALDLFAEATRLRSTKEANYELAVAAARLRQDDLALESYEVALGAGLDGPAAEKAQAFVAEKSKELGRLDVRGPAGAEVYVAARLRGTLPLPRPIVAFAGKRRIELRYAGDRQEQEALVEPGKTRRVDFLAQKPNAVPGSSGAAGSARTGDAGTTRAETPETDRSLGTALTIGGASVLVLGGVTFFIAASNVTGHRDRLAELCAVPNGSDACTSAHPGQKAQAQDEVDAIATWKGVRTAGFVGLGVGAVATGVGVALLLSGPKSKPKTSTWLVAPTPGGAFATYQRALW